MPDTTYTALVGCQVPIQQAPMGSISSPQLATAVADAGGVGTISAFGMPADRLAQVLDDLNTRTKGAIGVNFLTAELDLDAVRVASQHARIVDFFWFDPNPEVISLAHEGGALVTWQVGSVAEASAAVEAGADVLAVQGTEAGGHVRGSSPLLPLLSAVLDRVDVPVIAAGGIADGRTLAAVLAAGAAGARLGTRFVASEEAAAHERYKQAIVDAGFESTEVTDAFAVCPLCATSPRARALRSSIEAVRALAVDEIVGTAMMGPSTVDVVRGSGMPPGAGATGNLEAMAMYAGESAALCDRVEPAAAIVERLVADAERLLRR